MEIVGGLALMCGILLLAFLIGALIISAVR